MSILLTIKAAFNLTHQQCFGRQRRDLSEGTKSRASSDLKKRLILLSSEVQCKRCPSLRLLNCFSNFKILKSESNLCSLAAEIIFQMMEITPNAYDT